LDIIDRNRRAWNRESVAGSEWSTPVGDDVIHRARDGTWQVILTPTRAVPRDWLGDVAGKDVLCLASGGGQQAPVLAAARADVVSFDLSEEQLAKDRQLAERHGLALRCVQGDMADLSALADEAFDLVFHPVSNVFAPDPRPVWRECHRVARPGGVLLAGFMNPSFFLFDHDAAAAGGALEAVHRLPYREPDSLVGDARREWDRSGRAAEFGHSLEAQIGGQLEAGFVLTGLYEDTWSESVTPLCGLSPVAIATRAVRGPM
jgi:SAM-dependent methyltransferase